MYAYSIAPDFDVALLHFRGDMRGKGLIANTRALHEDARWHEGMDVIWDCRGVRSLGILPAELLKVVELRTEDTEGRDASVVARTLDEGLAKLYRMIAERKGKKAFVCHSLEEALEVLGLEAHVGEELERGVALCFERGLGFE